MHKIMRGDRFSIILFTLFLLSIRVSLCAAEGAIGKALGTCYERAMYMKALEKNKQLDIGYAKQEVFPYYEKMITALEEYAGYFLFWEVYYYSFSDIKRAKNLLEETAKRYPDATSGKIARSLLDKKKDAAELSSLIQAEFKKLPNPVESYKPNKGEPRDCAMNKLKEAIASTREYNKWKKIFIEKEYPDTTREKAQNLAFQMINNLVNILDESIAGLFRILAGHCRFSTGNQEEAFALYQYYIKIIIDRYPHTSRAGFAKRDLEEFTKWYKGVKGKE